MSFRNSVSLWSLWIFSLNTVAAQAQQFVLTTPDRNISSKAFLTDAKLDIIDAQGEVNSYARDLNYDTADGQWLGYRNRTTGKVLRWPQNNSGNLQIGNPQAKSVTFTPSKMIIQPVDNPALGRGLGGVPAREDSGLGNDLANFGSVQETNSEYRGKQWSNFSSSDLFTRVIANPANRLPSAQAVHLVSQDNSGGVWAITQRGAKLGCTSQVNSQALWWITPAGPGIVRLQMQHDGQIWTVGAHDHHELRLNLVSDDPRQLWRVSHGHPNNNQFMLENAFYVGNYLTNLGAGNIGLKPMLALPTQMWLPLTPPANYLSTLQPFWKNVSREIRPNAALPPAEVELINTHKYALMVLIGDLRSGQVVKEVRIEPSKSEFITVERDPGSTIVEVVEVMTAAGGWNRQEYVTQIPPVSLYDLSVYEEILQSIAIDRTGKSPNRIEDVNYQPKSVGLLALPPGEALPERGQLQVFDQAKSAQNPGAVRRIDPKRLEKPRSDPLESILEDAKRKKPPSGGRSF